MKRTMTTNLLVALASAGLLFTACGGGGQAVEAAEATAKATTGRVPFHDLSMAAKGEFMKKVVMPEMKKRFQAFDPQTYADFSCKTCHGLDPRARGFEMPSPDLYALPAFGSEEHETLKAHDGRILAFMSTEVVPVMAELLGEPKFDPATGKGFGCMECHTAKP